MSFPPKASKNKDNEEFEGFVEMLRPVFLRLRLTYITKTRGAPPHLLVVGDSSMDRVVISGILRSFNFRVTAMDSGKRALELLASEANVSMIFTDYSMLEMTGYEVLKKVKGSSKLREIPMVIMSSVNVPTRINRCLEEGAEDFLLNPIQPSDVSHLCSRLLQ
ncbi:two-component response regulator ORR5-like [Triticum aestivum]|uniref:two-component response regulator ORR5-like n=1 Tax=Triticum aestivum TaxID=4565 RepID=UPI001D026FCF|nr:two-component response regulator ORR5-like [Triticum aestivum]